MYKVQTGFIKVLTKIENLQESQKITKTQSQNTKATGSQVKCPKKSRLMAHFHYSAELALSVPSRAGPIFGCVST